MLAEILQLVQLVVIVGGGIAVLSRMGARIDALTKAIDRLTQVLDGHDERIRALETQR